jgi:hypothetical protein
MLFANLLVDIFVLYVLVLSSRMVYKRRLGWQKTSLVFSKKWQTGQ